MTVVLNIEKSSDQCGPLCFQHCHGRFSTLSHGYLSHHSWIKHVQFVWCLYVYMRVCAISSISFSCSHYGTYEHKYTHMDAHTCRNAHTHAKEEVPNHRIPNIKCSNSIRGWIKQLWSVSWFPLSVSVTVLHTLISWFHNFPWHNFMSRWDRARQRERSRLGRVSRLISTCNGGSASILLSFTPQ